MTWVQGGHSLGLGGGQAGFLEEVTFGLSTDEGAASRWPGSKDPFQGVVGSPAPPLVRMAEEKVTWKLQK